MSSFHEEFLRKQKAARENELKAKNEAKTLQSAFKSTDVDEQQRKLRRLRERERQKMKESQKIMQETQLNDVKYRKKERPARANLEDLPPLERMAHDDDDLNLEELAGQVKEKAGIFHHSWTPEKITTSPSPSPRPDDSNNDLSMSQAEEDQYLPASVSDLAATFDAAALAAAASASSSLLQPMEDDDNNNDKDVVADADADAVAATVTAYNSSSDEQANKDAQEEDQQQQPSPLKPELPERGVDLNNNEDEKKEIDQHPPAEQEQQTLQQQQPQSNDQEAPAAMPSPATTTAPEEETKPEHPPEPEPKPEPEPEPEKATTDPTTEAKTMQQLPLMESSNNNNKEPEQQEEKSTTVAVAEEQPPPTPAESTAIVPPPKETETAQRQQPPEQQEKTELPLQQQQQQQDEEEDDGSPPFPAFQRPDNETREEEERPMKVDSVVAKQPLKGHKTKVRLDVLFSFGLLTSSDKPYLDNYMAAVEHVVRQTVEQDSYLNQYVRYDPAIPPFVQDYSKDETYHDPAQRPNVRRVLVVAATPVFLANGISIKQAREGICAGLQRAMQTGEFIRLAKRGMKPTASATPGKQTK